MSHRSAGKQMGKLGIAFSCEHRSIRVSLGSLSVLLLMYLCLFVLSWAHKLWTQLSLILVLFTGEANLKQSLEKPQSLLEVNKHGYVSSQGSNICHISSGCDSVEEVVVLTNNKPQTVGWRALVSGDVSVSPNDTHIFFETG